MNDLNRKEDRYWTIKEIIHHIINYLKKRSPGSLAERLQKSKEYTRCME